MLPIVVRNPVSPNQTCMANADQNRSHQKLRPKTIQHPAAFLCRMKKNFQADCNTRSPNVETPVLLCLLWYILPESVSLMLQQHSSGAPGSMRMQYQTSTCRYSHCANQSATANVPVPSPVTNSTRECIMYSAKIRCSLPVRTTMPSTSSSPDPFAQTCV